VSFANPMYDVSDTNGVGNIFGGGENSGGYTDVSVNGNSGAEAFYAESAVNNASGTAQTSGYMDVSGVSGTNAAGGNDHTGYVDVAPTPVADDEFGDSDVEVDC